MHKRERGVLRAVLGLSKTSQGVQDGKGFIYVYLFVYVSFILGLFVVYGLTQACTEVFKYSQHTGPAHLKWLHYDSR